MRRLWFVILFAAGVVLFPAAGSAILYIDINSPGGRRMPIALPSFITVAGDPALAADIPKVLAADLGMTALFEVIPSEAYLEKVLPAHFAGKPLSFPDWKLIGAEAVVIGRVEARGDQVTVEMRLYDSTLGKLMAGRRYSGPARHYRLIGHKFANEVLYAFTGVRGIFDTEIAFSARPGKGRSKEVYVVGLDGQDPRPVTNNRSFNLFPRWSPDGNTLAYTSFRTGVPVVYLRNLRDGKERALVKFGNTKSPGCFSQGGESLYVSVSVNGNSDIYRVRVSDGAVEKAVEGWGIEVSPSLSPDGKKIAFVSNRSGSPQVYVRDLAASSGERRISHAGGYSSSPSWSPVGDRIAFTSQSAGNFSLYTVNADGSDQRLLASGDGDCTDPSYSPDGRYVVYSFQKKGYSELRIISADGRSGKRLYSGFSDAGSPAWSPRR
ncbi:MAG: Tol-Pal system beta propeller repeat protein TolB [Deltaproteobacteria bacterium]|nr:Tol-Pal system beta propeller repeat protein TolB [Deltaproteobacteria bacterium]